MPEKEETKGLSPLSELHPTLLLHRADFDGPVILRLLRLRYASAAQKQNCPTPGFRLPPE
jgi:hypothetical protein